MRLAANTLVVIILGITLVGVGIYFLESIVTTGNKLQSDLRGPERDRVLNSMPSDREVYLDETNLEVSNGAVRLPIGLYNRFGGSIKPTFTVKCETCGGSPMNFVTNGENTIPSGERRVVLGILSNESWGPQQYVMSLNVSNETGPQLGSTTFRVSR